MTSLNQKLLDANYTMQGKRIRQINWVAMMVSRYFTGAFRRFSEGETNAIGDAYDGQVDMLANYMRRLMVVGGTESFVKSVEAMPAGLRKWREGAVTEARDNSPTGEPLAVPAPVEFAPLTPIPGTESLWEPLTLEEIDASVFDAEWARFVGKNEDHVRNLIKQGVSGGKDHRIISREIQSAFQQDRVSATRVARTEGARVNLIAQEDSMRKVFGNAVKGWQYVATLDVRTRPWHANLDGTIYTDGEARPLLPDGFNCRCIYSPVTKSSAEMGIPELDEMLGQLGRDSMDGDSASSERYPEWFGRQSAERQKEIIGKKRFNELRGKNSKASWNAYAQSPGSPAKIKPEATLRGNRAAGKIRVRKVNRRK